MHYRLWRVPAQIATSVTCIQGHLKWRLQHCCNISFYPSFYPSCVSVLLSSYQVLRDIGLQSSVTPATFYDLATHVAAKGAALGATATTTATATASGSSGLSGVLDAADALLQHLHNYHHGFGADRGFYQRLGQVAFVPATLGVPGESSGV